jgi:DNA-binding MarR family transcriptional regulator
MAAKSDVTHRPRIEPVAPDRPPRSVGFLISSLGFLTSKRFMKALSPLGIGPREWTLLRFVAASEGQSQQALAERLGSPPSRMVALVDGLEEGGLLERRPDPDDRRIRALHLTAKGRRILGRASRVAMEFEKQLCSGLDEKERERLIDLLQKLQAEQIERPGVHPGLAREHPGSLEA